MTYQTAHNGGRVQTQPWFIGLGGDFAPINMLKTGSSWEYTGTSLALLPDELDANGYPTTLAGGPARSVFYIAGEYPGRRSNIYWVFAQGQGSLIVGGGTLRSGSQTASGGALAAELEMPTTTISDLLNTNYGQVEVDLYIMSKGTSDYLKAIALVHEDDVSAYQAGQLWAPGFVSRMRNDGVGWFRPMDWQPANWPSVALWEHRKPLNYFSWFAPEMRASLYGGVTTNTGSDFTVPVPPGGFTLTHGAIVILKFNTAPSDTARLRVGTSGTYKNMRSITARPLSYDEQPGTPAYPSAFQYHQTFDCWLCVGYGLSGGNVPPESICDLGATVGCHVTHYVPVTAMEPVTNYALSLAQMCKAFNTTNNTTWMTHGVSSGNEVWNKNYRFKSTYLAETVSAVLWGLVDGSGNPYDHDEAYGMFLSRLGQIWKTEWASRTSEYEVIVESQAVGGAGKLNPRLAAQQYVNHGGTPASDWITAVSGASYWSSYDQYQASIGNWTPLISRAQAYADATTDAERAAVRDAYVQTGIDFVTVLMPTYASPMGAIAVANGWRFLPYEGNYSPDKVGDAQIDALQMASKYSPYIIPLQQRVYRLYESIGATYLSAYVLSGRSEFAHFWPTIFDAETPAWTAHKLHGKGLRRIMVT